MPFHVIIGAGATALATARLLAEDGEQVRLVSRRGTSTPHERVEPVALDATDADALTEICRGAATVFNCAMPAYHTWPLALPPLFRAILSAAERGGARYVMLGNLYGYGPVRGPVTEDLPLLATGPKGVVRAQMWQEALAAHEAGRVRAAEVRAGQFLGAGAVSSFTLTVAPAVLAGRLALTPAALDTTTGYTAVGDAARALVGVARAEDAFGQAWHAPAGNATVRELATLLAKLASAPAPQLETLTERDTALLSLTSPLWAEFEETAHMSHQDFVVDSRRIQRRFGLAPTPVEEVLAAPRSGAS
ncbi:NAD-dependent epimerase/dehydratase [Catenulispora acidiphila DSM 44928]|uniref:NAD-dependent epimerase/dehydratase n=1 Tax=Catenulispora acidiphila (strain DSM 44928 / JCM 14897 / NBRC 102108 / NRRL B-24433 / ID139908) TaxID=479433 RepID=C7Q558_CATAD|nr:NAD-dependent epimerase/dehydratase family protein [Catenulispora acidiphila]ACU75827.1 NAD-dependent epimerase/dehydratase [Catenulispora acidiphila DSM 44928]